MLHLSLRQELDPPTFLLNQAASVRLRLELGAVPGGAVVGALLSAGLGLRLGQRQL